MSDQQPPAPDPLQLDFLAFVERAADDVLEDQLRAAMQSRRINAEQRADVERRLARLRDRRRRRGRGEPD